ncbi:hypothetical protein DRQ53_12315 [bacterium]|nr:MAG: hypothetical protein DRQ53_12315 [bacterium]
MPGRALLLLLILSFLAGIGSARAQPAVVDSNTVVVLPFANYSGRYESLRSVMPVFYSRLDSAGLHVMSHDDLRPLLREHRIRVVGRMGTRSMDILRAETGVRLAIVGSIDIYEPDRALEVMISARLVDLRQHAVLTAISVGKTVQETERSFGRDRAQAIEEVIDLVVDEFMAAMGPAIRARGPRPDRYHACGLVSVIPLENYSKRRHGAEVLQNLLMSELVARNWTIVEPGIVQEILLEAQRLARGGVSDDVLRLLRDQTGACLVVTGEVEEFSVAPGQVDNAVPRLGYGLRLVDARELRLLATIDQERDGMKGEHFFARGREYSMARLARETMEDVVTWISKEGER